MNREKQLYLSVKILKIKHAISLIRSHAPTDPNNFDTLLPAYFPSPEVYCELLYPVLQSASDGASTSGP